MHLVRHKLVPTGALLFEKCARDSLSAPTDIHVYPKVKSDTSRQNPILTPIVRVTILIIDNGIKRSGTGI